MISEIRKNFDLVVVMVVAFLVYSLLKRWTGRRLGVAL